MVLYRRDIVHFNDILLYEGHLKTSTVLHSKRVDFFLELHADLYSSIDHRKRQDGTQKRFVWLVLRSYIKQHINMYVLMTRIEVD